MEERGHYTVIPSPPVLFAGGEGQGGAATTIHFKQEPSMKTLTTNYIRELRQNTTYAEKYLWYFLCAKRLNGYKIRRQHLIYKIPKLINH